MAPSLAATIRRRVLLTYRADPAVVRPLVPEAFGLRLVDGWAMTGVCLIRLERVRPGGMPLKAGLSSESVAYRTAVLGADGPSVFIPHRDTTSRLQAAAGGRLFPARFGHASIDVVDAGDRIEISVCSDGGDTNLHLVARPAVDLAPGSAFGSLDAASEFFESAPVGWTGRRDGQLDGIELRTSMWRVGALAVEQLESGYFDDRGRFPAGSIAFDSALVMRDIEHEWHAHPGPA